MMDYKVFHIGMVRHMISKYNCSYFFLSLNFFYENFSFLFKSPAPFHGIADAFTCVSNVLR
jgi:hypothetical protein